MCVCKSVCCGCVAGWCRREPWIGSALILTAQCHTRCNTTPTLPHNVFEQPNTHTHHRNQCTIVWLVLCNLIENKAKAGSVISMFNQISIKNTLESPIVFFVILNTRYLPVERNINLLVCWSVVRKFCQQYPVGILVGLLFIFFKDQKMFTLKQRWDDFAVRWTPDCWAITSLCFCVVAILQ